MPRAFEIGWLLVLTAGLALPDQNKGGAPPARKEAPARPAPRNGAAPKGVGLRLNNPASPAARLYRATPEERDRVIEKLPAERQAAIRKQLEYFDSLPKAQQEIMLQRTERLAAMPPEKRRAFMQQLQNLNQLPLERRQAVGMALRRLQVMPEAQRNAVLNSDEFRSRFSPEEQKIIADLSEVMLPPM